MNRKVAPEETLKAFYSLTEVAIPSNGEEGRNSMASRFLLELTKDQLDDLIKDCPDHFKDNVMTLRADYKQIEARRLYLGEKAREFINGTS